MKHKRPYWNGTRPSDGKRWRDAEQAALLNLTDYGPPLMGLYRRYAKQWNDVELNHSRKLSEHTFLIHGARVVGASCKFILVFDQSEADGWILDVTFPRSFSQYQLGSFGLNAVRSLADIRRAALHWRGAGQQHFEEWLREEASANGSQGEWAEYKA